MGRSKLSSRPAMVIVAAVCALFAGTDHAALAQSSPPAAAGTGVPGKVTGLAFDGRMVANLEKSIKYYKAVGFTVVGSEAPRWTKDSAENHLFKTKGAKCRTATLQIGSALSDKPFTLILREYKGIERKSRGDLKPWDPTASHIDLTVADPDALWEQLRAAGELRPLTEGGKIIKFPGQTTGGAAYMLDPDGMDVEIIGQRPNMPAANGRPASEATRPGFDHIGLIVVNFDKAVPFYGGLLGEKFPPAPTQWFNIDFLNAMINGKGNILRMYNGTFAEALAPDARMRFELIEFQNVGKKQFDRYKFADIGVNYIGLQVENLDALYARLKAAGVDVWSEGGIVKLKDGTRAAVVRDPDVGGFVELLEKKNQ